MLGSKKRKARTRRRETGDASEAANEPLDSERRSSFSAREKRFKISFEEKAAVLRKEAELCLWSGERSRGDVGIKKNRMAHASGLSTQLF